MATIDLRTDADTFRAALTARLAEFKALVSRGQTLSGIVVGYDCAQGGWIFVHPDTRAKYARDGNWTVCIEDPDTLEMPHWGDAVEAWFEGEPIEVFQVDGTRAQLPGYDEESEEGEDENFSLSAAIGRMLLHVLLEAQANGSFDGLGEPGTVQLDIEDFNGEWGWPEYDELGSVGVV